ncbi:MAG: hypothetical protein A2845_01835 [Candidatus Lloydbacteria bacterium RIFCSPHIGHO2_01_FULL_49_22]|uniref:Uncharacterized protein n=1 Tax=Candidatus Lloydbacteria bacterium RIFCSPHIGHO2_01_FULL_49_22 TaxID=1798658 RepID=A0A1G2CXN3_9BACT|nr:MAG: hypothetical protein A2845_01835 [Candidatus Lloydbacteria bacterium RIFCSPHIGHO2_01_FULL_49_22]
MYRTYLWWLFALAIGLFGGEALCALPEGDNATVRSEEIAERMALVQEMQAYESRIGWKQTNNFRRYDGRSAGYLFCYYTDIFAQNTSWAVGADGGCNLDPRRYDVFLMRADAVAGVGAPLSPSLVQASLARFIMVIFHEDFHEQVDGYPSLAINESAATLMGLLAAREFTKEKFGVFSFVYIALENDLQLHVHGSLLLRGTYAELGALYMRVRDGSVTEDDGQREKQRIFARLKEACADMQLATIASCRDSTNNAELGFNYSYAAYYQSFFELATNCGWDVYAIGAQIVRLVKEIGRGTTGDQFIDRVNELMRKSGRTSCGTLFLIWRIGTTVRKFRMNVIKFLNEWI